MLVATLFSCREQTAKTHTKLKVNNQDTTPMSGVTLSFFSHRKSNIFPNIFSVLYLGPSVEVFLWKKPLITSAQKLHHRLLTFLVLHTPMHLGSKFQEN